MISYSRRAFTLIEIMIVMAIIAIILSIGIPGYFTMIQTSKRTVCINNLKKIAAAVDQYAIEHAFDAGTKLSSRQEDELYSDYLKGGEPSCPSGGEYIIETINSNPQVTCTKEDEGHVLQ